MDERKDDPRRRKSTIGLGDETRTSRRNRSTLLKSRPSAFRAILLGLATIPLVLAGPLMASMTSAAQTPVVRVASELLQQPPAANATNARSGQGETRTSAAASCVDKTRYYVDCGNGTVAESATGLIWLKQADCLGELDWQSAKNAAAVLKNGDCMLTDGSSPGDWRLPTDAEWRATMEKARMLGCTGPTLANDAGTACISDGPTSFIGVQADYYWSGTPENAGYAWFGDLDHANMLKGIFLNKLRVWPVRNARP